MPSVWFRAWWGGGSAGMKCSGWSARDETKHVVGNMQVTLLAADDLQTLYADFTCVLFGQVEEFAKAQLDQLRASPPAHAAAAEPAPAPANGSAAAPAAKEAPTPEQVAEAGERLQPADPGTGLLVQFDLLQCYRSLARTAVLLGTGRVRFASERSSS